MSVLVSSPLHGSLPFSRTRLIGREAEIAAARTFLLEEAVPLLTLTGPGGVGKTRLALAIAADVAAHFADGVVWVDLSPLADVSPVAGAVATALGLIPSPDQPLTKELARVLRSRQTLLVLDNCEHVLSEAVELVASLLSQCPALQVLTTSRVLLHLHGEHLLTVDPLPLPADADALSEVTQNAAVRLFTERARAVRPAFTLTETNAPTVAALCRQLDGLPLAIELAAARSTVLSPEALLAQMNDRLQLLTHGPRNLPARQQTIAATIGWSYDLLEAEAQTLFHRVAVFAGGFTLEGAHAVGAPTASLHDFTTTLEALVAQSLVRRTDGEGEARFGMLETVRAFALERLAEAGEEQRIRARHAAYFADLAERADREVRGPQGAAWIARCQRELPNVRVALGWAETTDGDPSVGLRLAAALNMFWVLRNRVEGCDWLERLLARGAEVPSDVRANALLALGFLLAQEPVGTQADDVLDESAALFARLQDALGLTHVAHYRSILAVRQGDPERAEPLLKAAITDYAARGMTAWEAICVFHMSNVAIQRNDLYHARELLAASLQLQERAGWEAGKAVALGNLGWIAALQGDLDYAETMDREALALAWKNHNLLGVFDTVVGLAWNAAQRGDGSRAARWGGAAQRLSEQIGTLLETSDHPDLVAVTQYLLQDAFLDAWEAGRAVPIERVVAEATDPHFRMPDERGAASPGQRSNLERGDHPTLAATPLLIAHPTARPSAASPDHPMVEPATRHGDLTHREQEVLGLLCQRLTDAEIAERLFVSPYTASKHVSNILSKLGAANRREAAALAVRHRLA
jgi:non-specific serine/threonine protein kinase